MTKGKPPAPEAGGSLPKPNALANAKTETDRAEIARRLFEAFGGTDFSRIDNLDDYSHGTAETHLDGHYVFYLRIIQTYCHAVSMGREVPPWILKAIAERFLRVLTGEAWSDAFPLPWAPHASVRTRAEEQALQIFIDVFNRARSHLDQPITAIIKAVAEQHAVSYETARAGYYKFRRLLSKELAKL